MRDKLAQGTSDFAAEEYGLRGKRGAVAAAYRDAIINLAAVVEEAAAMFPNR